MEIKKIQEELKRSNIEGWLFYDFHNRDQSAIRILGLDETKIFSRRWFYFIPAEGTPVKICHKMEPDNLDHLPGNKIIYLPWQQLNEHVKNTLSSFKRIAMQYSPNNAIPYVSIVDAGTAEYIRSLGVEIITSADLITRFESRLSTREINSHIDAYKLVSKAKDIAFKKIAARIKAGDRPKEFEIQQVMIDFMYKNQLIWDMGPIVSINGHNADPHFMPNPENSYYISKGDLVLIDVWAKKKAFGSIYADITWMGYVGEKVPAKHEDIFRVCCKARDAAVRLVKKSFVRDLEVRGCDVDDVSRKVVSDAGYGEYFIHRTGHNIGVEVHGTGVHIDNLETRDDRALIKGTCFSIEPGIYMPEKNVGYRTEIDVYINDVGDVQPSGEVQKSIIPILSL